MYAGQKEKLERYLRNAERFLWGVIPGDKRTVFATLQSTLKEIGEEPLAIPKPKQPKPTYAMVTEDLLAKLGIEKVLTRVVGGQVRRQFEDRPGALDFLRAHWLSGSVPRWETLKSLRAPRTMKQRLLDAVETKEAPEVRQRTSDILDAFLEVNPQFRYVHGWTAFAGLWFEEVEPLLKENTPPPAGLPGEDADSRPRG